MKNVITFGGERFDSSDRLKRLIAENAVYYDDDEMPGVIDTLEIEPSPADEHTATWLLSIGATHTQSDNHNLQK